MNKITQYLSQHAYDVDEIVKTVEFTTLGQLLDVPWVKSYVAPDFKQYSIDYVDESFLLTIEYNRYLQKDKYIVGILDRDIAELPRTNLEL